jgi:hypothetical protein
MVSQKTTWNVTPAKAGVQNVLPIKIGNHLAGCGNTSSCRHSHEGGSPEGLEKLDSGFRRNEDF